MFNDRVLLSGVTWETLEKLDVTLHETGARLIFLDGCLEIVAPFSEAHEEPKTTVRQLLEIYLRLKGIRFYGCGSATIGTKAINARKEPDESYRLGAKKSVPDLIVEIVVTNSGIDILEIYRRIGVQEIWFWEDGVISVYCLRANGYELVSKSELLPELDLRSLEFHSRLADQFDAVNAFMRTIA